MERIKAKTNQPEEKWKAILPLHDLAALLCQFRKKWIILPLILRISLSVKMKNGRTWRKHLPDWLRDLRAKFCEFSWSSPLRAQLRRGKKEKEMKILFHFFCRNKKYGCFLTTSLVTTDIFCLKKQLLGEICYYCLLPVFFFFLLSNLTYWDLLILSYSSTNLIQPGLAFANRQDWKGLIKQEWLATGHFCDNAQMVRLSHDRASNLYNSVSQFGVVVEQVVKKSGDCEF